MGSVSPTFLGGNDALRRGPAWTLPRPAPGLAYLRRRIDLERRDEVLHRLDVLIGIYVLVGGIKQAGAAPPRFPHRHRHAKPVAHRVDRPGARTVGRHTA